MKPLRKGKIIHSNLFNERKRKRMKGTDHMSEVFQTIFPKGHQTGGCNSSDITSTEEYVLNRSQDRHRALTVPNRPSVLGVFRLKTDLKPDFSVTLGHFDRLRGVRSPGTAGPWFRPCVVSRSPLRLPPRVQQTDW